MEGIQVQLLLIILPARMALPQETTLILAHPKQELDRTWSSSSFTNSNHHTRWFWFTAGDVAQKSVRILTIPTTFGWNSVQSSIEQGSSGSATLYVPSSFASYIQGTANEGTGDPQLSTNGSYDERFHWRITPSSTSNSLASGFTTTSGYFSGPSNNASIAISPTTSASAGTYYLKLYYYSPTGATAGTSTLVDTISFSVTALAPLDTNITLTSSSIVVGNTTNSYTQGLTGGGSNTIYYILNANNLANGSNIEALRAGGDSRYIARTYTSTSSRSFRTSASGSYVITNLPSSSTSDTYYVYAANGLGTNSTLLSDTYIVDRPDVSISLTPSTTSLSASDALDDATSPTVNVTGDTFGTQYRLYTNNIPRWIDTHNGGGTASTTDFRIKYSQNELPPAGSTYTYFTQARIPSTYGGSGTWINTGNSFTITRSSADLTPDSPTSQFTNLTQRVTSTQYTEDWQTTGITSGNQITWTATVSGGGGSSVQLSTNNSTWVTGAQGIQRSLNQTGYVRVGTGSSQNTTYTATLTSGSTTGSWSVATASTGTGGQQTGGGNAFQYGLEIKNPGGTATIIDSTSKIGTIIATAQYSIAANSAGQQKFLGFDCSNATQTCLIFNAGAQYFNMPYFTRRTAAQQGVILKPNPNAAQTVSGEIYLIRY